MCFLYVSLTLFIYLVIGCFMSMYVFISFVRSFVIYIYIYLYFFLYRCPSVLYVVMYVLVIYVCV